MKQNYQNSGVTTPFPQVGEGLGMGADHLGNVRSVISSDTNEHLIAQASDYYPFGMEISKYGSFDNQLKYNSKELQTEADLDWYDYGARFYDPVLGAQAVNLDQQRPANLQEVISVILNHMRLLNKSAGTEQFIRRVYISRYLVVATLLKIKSSHFANILLSLHSDPMKWKEYLQKAPLRSFGKTIPIPSSI